MSYLGAKNGAGVYQAIINLMPPHDKYIEPFLGTGAIMRRKPPAVENIGSDLDKQVIKQFFKNKPFPRNTRLRCASALRVLGAIGDEPKTLVYCDPPYMHSTRTSSSRYRFEMSDDDHRILLETLIELKCLVMVSGYKNALYDELIGDWFNTSFQAMTRGGVRTETVWCNFNPGEAHYHTYAGKNFTDRQRIKRKAASWARRFARLPLGERQAIMAAMLSATADSDRS